jgi:hypothetical protein
MIILGLRDDDDNDNDDDGAGPSVLLQLARGGNLAKGVRASWTANGASGAKSQSSVRERVDTLIATLGR